MPIDTIHRVSDLYKNAIQYQRPIANQPDSVLRAPTKEVKELNRQNFAIGKSKVLTEETERLRAITELNELFTSCLYDDYEGEVKSGSAEHKRLMNSWKVKQVLRYSIDSLHIKEMFFDSCFALAANRMAGVVLYNNVR